MAPAPIQNEYVVTTLNEYFDAVSSITRICKEGHDSPEFSPLWFRGHEKNNYILLPTLFREHLVRPNHNESYSSMHLGEEYRYQSFKARAFHKVNSRPESRSEWQEIMQHHLTWTRLMDWSESAISALLFALEVFINTDDGKDLKDRRKYATPVVWVLRPYMLNRQVYKSIAPENRSVYPFIERVLHDIAPEGISVNRFANNIGKELLENIDKYFSGFGFTGNMEKPMMDGIIGLSVIETYRQANADRLYPLISKFEFNPFFYILCRYYSDGVCAPYSDKVQLPPLAIIHPYHSERIKAQRGAFTVFPYYIPENSFDDIPDVEMLKEMGTDLRAMEFQKDINRYLFKIRICNADIMAKDLLSLGERRSSLYPELEFYSKEIEIDKYHV